MRRLTVVAALSLTALTGCPDSDGDDHNETSADPDTSGPSEVTPPTGACDNAADCEALATSALPACQRFACLNRQCIVDFDEGTPCDDGNPCTLDDRCGGGACTGPTPACDDGNPCTTDGCSPETGECVTTYNQRPCDDGDGCTSSDRCFGGACVGTHIDCDDQNPCTSDRCDAAMGCVNTPTDGACDDGDACTSGDRCSAGRCESGAAITCGDPTNPCQRASCDAVTGCTIEILSGACDDSNACTEHDACIEGVCAGTLMKCNDGNVCTDDYCDPAKGCQTANNVLACDDEDPCTLVDKCSGGVCVGSGDNPNCCGGAESCDDNSSCTIDSCVDGLCVFEPLDCADGNPCTADACVDGVCSNPPWGPIPDDPVIISDAETADDVALWVITSTNDEVTWQRDTTMAHRGVASLYCGSASDHTYDHGHTFATATRELVIMPGTVTLSFWVLADLEEQTSCTYDALHFFVDDTELTPGQCASVDSWTKRTFDVSAWAGQPVDLRFVFDTFDDQANGGGGVWVDDIELTYAEAPACCVGASECPGDPDTTCDVATCLDYECGIDRTGCD